MDELAMMSRRLGQLEGQVRRLRAAALALLACFALGALDQPSEVRAQRFVVVDKEGRESAHLAAGLHGGELELNLLRERAPSQVGLHAEAGELRITETHGDDMLYVGMLGTRCYGRLSVEPPLSAQASPDSSIQLRVDSDSPSLLLQTKEHGWGMSVGQKGPEKVEN